LIKTNKKKGPIEFHEDVLQAMATPATSHVAPNFIPALGESIELLRKVLFTSGQPFIIAGSGTLGWDMTACNLVEAGEDVLVCNSGYFGDRFGEWYVLAFPSLRSNGWIEKFT
jgi:alanine-glyoxylate transaminase/serine-glyoxylate transaminase/serine-pyruvate transaminase